MGFLTIGNVIWSFQCKEYTSKRNYLHTSLLTGDAIFTAVKKKLPLQSTKISRNRNLKNKFAHVVTRHYYFSRKVVASNLFEIIIFIVCCILFCMQPYFMWDRRPTLHGSLLTDRQTRSRSRFYRRLKVYRLQWRKLMRNVQNSKDNGGPRRTEVPKQNAWILWGAWVRRRL